MSLYIFALDDMHQPMRIPLAKWQRILNKTERMPVFSNRAVNIAYAYIEIEYRQPVYCPRIDGVIHRFDQRGEIVDSDLPPIDLIAGLSINLEKVVDFNQRLAQRQYEETYRWEVGPEMIQKIIDSIWQ